MKMKTLCTFAIPLLLLLLSAGLSDSFQKDKKTPELVALVKRGSYYQYIDTEGEKILDIRSTEADIFSEGLACIQRGREFHFVNLEGDTVIKNKYFNYKTKFQYGHARAHEGHGNMRLMDRSGKYVKAFTYLETFKDGLALCTSREGKTGFIDSTLEWKIMLSGTGMTRLTSFSDGYASFTAKKPMEGKRFKPKGFIDKDGKVAIEAAYIEVGAFSEGLVAVNATSELRSPLWGYINEKGKMVVKPKYIKALEFSDGLASVRDTSRKWTVINKKGQTVLDVPIWNDGVVFSEGLAACYDAEAKKWGYIDKKGKWAIPPTFNGGGKFINGFAIVETSSAHRTKGFINKKGELIADGLKEAFPFVDPYATNE